MSTAKVLEIQTLQDLSTALSRFAGEAGEALTAVEAEIARTQDFLQRCLRHWQQEVQRREMLYRQAQQALQRCLNTVHYDREGRPHRPSCHAEQAAVDKAGKALEEARRELENVRHWMSRVEQATREYHREAGRLRELASTRTEQARAFLSRKYAALERYVNQMIKVFGPLPVWYMLYGQYQRWQKSAASSAIRQAKKQESELVQKTGRGTRPWTRTELRMLKRGVFPKGYEGHHINSVSRYPHLARNPDNIYFVKGRSEHLSLHRGRWGNPTSGKMFNRKSLMVQWSKD